MEQLTQEQAIAVYESGEWKDWGDEEIVKFQLYQDRLAVPFDKFHAAVGRVLGRSVWTHEFSSSNHANLIAEYEKRRPAPTFADILALLPQDRVIVVEPPRIDIPPE